jgi:hypothetical protein
MSLDEDVLETFRQMLAGPCRGVETHPFFTLVFERGQLIILSPWRASRGRWLIGGTGQPKKVPALVEVFVGQSVTWLAVKGPYNDLVLSFSEGLTLETFADSADYENWWMTGEHHEKLIAGPGELWSSFPPHNVV